MNSNRMSNKDMLNYCDEALAWEDFSPVDIFFFESVKKILLGESSPVEEPEIDDLLGIERPVGSEELEPDYDKYADEYYDEEIPQTDNYEPEEISDVQPSENKQESYSVSVDKPEDITDVSEEMKIFADTIFSDGFFDADDDSDDDDEYTENAQ